MKVLSVMIFLFMINTATALPTDDFVIRIKSDNPGGLPTEFLVDTSGGGYNYNVDCDDDGNFEAMAQTGDYICDYSISGAGIYTIRIQDNSGLGTGFPKILFRSVGRKLLSVNQWGTGIWAEVSAGFFRVRNVIFTTTDVPNFSSITSMRDMFSGAVMANPDTSSWDASLVTNMSAMFGSAVLANPDTSNWDTSLVDNMNRMFFGATLANPDTSNWDTSLVTNMSIMFTGATLANPDTSNWNTSLVTRMDSLFRNTSMANPDVSNWDTSSVTDMSNMFADAISANPDVSGWDTSLVTNTDSMFAGAISANPIISNWDVSSVTSMSNMFSGLTLPTAEYDAILINFSTQDLKSNVDFDAGNSQFCSTAAIAARDSMISFNGWNISDGGQCIVDDMFLDGFESSVVVFKTIEAQFTYDFSAVELLPEDETPKLIATGLDMDNQVDVKIYLRQLDGVLQLMQSLFVDVDGQQMWRDGLWYEVIEQDWSKIILW